jgi:hypothetical protein
LICAPVKNFVSHKELENILCVLILLLTATATAFGQVHISPGVTGGLHLSTLGGYDESGATAVTRYGAGIFAEISFPVSPISV